jgi:hypothetical protein
MATNGFFRTRIFTQEKSEFLLHSQTGYIEIYRQWQITSTNVEREKQPFQSKIKRSFQHPDKSGYIGFRARRTERTKNMASFWARRENELHCIHAENLTCL